MFAQVLEGKVRDVDGLRAQLEAWRSDLQAGADGWVGTTAGITADGTFLAVVRFESQEAAGANSSRPEQGEWWKATEATFDGGTTFTDCPDVDMVGAGGSDDAGFVQIIFGRADRSAILPIADELAATLRRTRPDVIGATAAWPGDGRIIQTVYFTSEHDARAAESVEPVSDEDRAASERLSSLMQMERFVDLSDPWLYSR